MFSYTFIYPFHRGGEMEIYYAISVSLLLLDFAKAQPDPWICTFQNDECGISQSSADYTYWYIPVNAGTAYYRPAINRAGDTYGTFATFILPPASYPNSGLGVLSFRFFSNTYYTPRYLGYLKVTTCEDGNATLILNNGKADWYFIEIPFTCWSSTVKIYFTAFRGYSRTNIGFDDINVTEILTTTTEAVTSATPQVTRGQTLTPTIAPLLTSSSIPIYTDATTRYNMSTGSILVNAGKGSVISNGVIIPVVSSICIVLICLIVTGYVFWRKRNRPAAIEDKDSDDNGDKLYTNPVYSSYNNAHLQPDLLVGTPAGHISQETQHAHDFIDEYEEFEGDHNPHSGRQGNTECNGDNRADIGENNLPAHAVLYDDEEYNLLDFNRDKFPKTIQNGTKSQTYKPSLPENSIETSTDDAFDYGVLECPGVHGDDEYSYTAKAIEDPKRSTADSKAPRYENSGPGAPRAADQMEEGPEYYSYQDSLPVRPEDRSSIEQARSATEAPREGDFEPIYSDEVYGDIQ